MSMLTVLGIYIAFGFLFVIWMLIHDFRVTKNEYLRIQLKKQIVTSIYVLVLLLIIWPWAIFMLITSKDELDI